MSARFDQLSGRPPGADPAADSRRLGSAILAAGFGKRMAPLTGRYLPKPLFPLGGKVPILETWVRKLVAAGLTDLSMNLCVLKGTIRRYFDDGSRFGAALRYVEEDHPSGTLGGVCKQVLGRQARIFSGETPPTQDRFPGDTIVAPSGDIVTNFDAEQLEELLDWHRRQGAAVTMVLTPIAWERRGDFGTVVLKHPQKRRKPLSQAGPVKDFREKDPLSPSNLNNASIYLIETRLLAELDACRTPADPDLAEPFYDFGKHVFPALLGRLDYLRLSGDNRLMGVQYDGAWHDVGQKRDYLSVNEAVLDGDLRVELPYDAFSWGYLGRGTDADLSKIHITPPVVIGNHCQIEAGVKLGPYAIIGDGWAIEQGAQISHSVLWERYSMRQADGTELPLDDQLQQNPQRIAAGVRIRKSIIAGGRIDRDVQESTVYVDDHGRVSQSPIDRTDTGPRA